MKVKLALEWFLNPDHLPFLVGIDKGLYAKSGIDLELIEPKDHYDGFKALADGEIHFATNEPLHLMESYRENILSLGNFFETEGGIIFSTPGYKKFLEYQEFALSTPAKNAVTDAIAFDIIKNHFMLKTGKNYESEDLEKNCVIESKDFYHIKNLKEGYDAAWLCFENFEGVEAEIEGLQIERVYLSQSSIPNFCALDLFSSHSFLEQQRSLAHDFYKITEDALALVAEDLEYIAHTFYKLSGTKPSPLMDAIIENTQTRFFMQFQNSKSKWKELYEYLTNKGISPLSEDEYSSLFIS